MSMQKGLFSINSLSVELGYSRRTLSKYLTDLRPVEVRGRVKLYRLKEVIDHLQPLLGGKPEASMTREETLEAACDLAERLLPYVNVKALLKDSEIRR